jgi:hypothetical protein
VIGSAVRQPVSNNETNRDNGGERNSYIILRDLILINHDLEHLMLQSKELLRIRLSIV